MNYPSKFNVLFACPCVIFKLLHAIINLFAGLIVEMKMVNWFWKKGGSKDTK